MTSETKVVGLAPIRIHRQEPIPWCTTHDRMMDDELARQRWCYEAGSDEQPCVVSMGGPDHKWWKDTE